jgi:hypothetical protein
MKAIQLGKGQGFANKPSQALTQGIEPTLDMVGFPAVFADRLMTVDGENRLVRIPEIAARVAAFVGARDAQPEVQTTRFTAVTDSHHVVAAAFWARMRYNRLYHEKVLPVNFVVCLGVLFPVNSTLCMSLQHIQKLMRTRWIHPTHSG